MEIQCPACKKMNLHTDRCARCGCDLTALERIARAGRNRLALGREALRSGKAEAALEQAALSWRLKKSRAAAKLAFLACLMMKDFTQARKWYGYATVVIH